MSPLSSWLKSPCQLSTQHTSLCVCLVKTPYVVHVIDSSQGVSGKQTVLMPKEPHRPQIVFFFLFEAGEMVRWLRMHTAF